MSVRVMSAVWSYGPTDSSQRFVLLALADNASDDGGNAYPSVEELARKCALSERTVIRALDALVTGGYLTRRRRQNTSNVYQIVLARLVSDTVSPSVSDNLSYTGESVSDTVSPRKCQIDTPYVTPCHPVSDTMSHDPSLNRPVNRQINHQGEKRGAVAPAPPAPADPPFQPVPEEVQRQKRRRGIKEPEPALTSTAPAAVKLLADLTGYWPGDDVAPALVKEFGETPDEPALGKAVEFWRLSGYKLTNWLGIAEWYKEIRRRPDWTPQDRFKSGNGANGHGKAAPAKTVSTPVPGSQPLFS